MSVTTELKTALNAEFKKAGLKKVQLARRLGIEDYAAHRLLDMDHPSKVPALEKALAYFGKRIVVTVEPIRRQTHL